MGGGRTTIRHHVADRREGGPNSSRGTHGGLFRLVHERRLQHDRPLTHGHEGKGRTNPYDFCVLDRTPLWKRQSVRELCPKCGEPGTGEGVVGEERRFFHSANKSCYLGMLNPVRPKVEEIKCSKCGRLGRESVSKGYRYIRHKDKVCYLGKFSNEST